MLRAAVVLSALLSCSLIRADEITMKSGDKFSGQVRRMQDGVLSLAVPTNRVDAGLTVYNSQKFRFANVRSVTFDKMQDRFEITLKGGDKLEARLDQIADGKLFIPGHNPIRLSSVKSFEEKP